MARPPEPMFVERQSYRRRRIGDAAKLLPFLGGVLMLMPVLWAEDARTAEGILYLFPVWAGLIVIVALLSRRLSDAAPGEDGGDERKG